jgi:hypothetical protein
MVDDLGLAGARIERCGDNDGIDAGRLRLRQLDYFAASGRGPSRTRLRGNARNLMALSLAYGGVPEDGWSENAVHERLVDLLGDGSRTLADVGATLDGLYRFSREVA